MQPITVKILCKTPSKVKQTRPMDLDKSISLWQAASQSLLKIGWVSSNLHTHWIHPWAQVIVRHRHINSDQLNRTISLLDTKIQAGKYTIVPFLFWQFCESSNKLWTDFYLILSLSHDKFVPALTLKVRIICFLFTSRDIKFHIYHTFIADVPKQTNQVLNIFYSDG